MVTPLRSSPIAIIPGGIAVGATVDVVTVAAIVVVGAGGTSATDGTSELVGVPDVTLGASVPGEAPWSGDTFGFWTAKNAMPPIAAAASANAAIHTPTLLFFLAARAWFVSSGP